MPEAADLLTPELRQALHQELHARPPQALVAPLAVTHWVQWIDEAERAASRQYLSELMAGAGLPAPAPEAAFVQADLGAFTLRWELHTEYVAWTVTRALTAEELMEILSAPARKISRKSSTVRMPPPTVTGTPTSPGPSL